MRQILKNFLVKEGDVVAVGAPIADNRDFRLVEADVQAAPDAKLSPKER